MSGGLAWLAAGVLGILLAIGTVGRVLRGNRCGRCDGLLEKRHRNQTAAQLAGALGVLVGVATGNILGGSAAGEFHGNIQGGGFYWRCMNCGFKQKPGSHDVSLLHWLLLVPGVLLLGGGGLVFVAIGVAALGGR